jgi:hypothetical protein
MKAVRLIFAVALYIVAAANASAQTGAVFNIAQTISDGAQRKTLAFDGLALMTGNLEAQSFFPPGKVADYTGFQYLRDNDPDNMGHNTSFLTRIAYNIIYLLNDSQFNQLKTLAVAQQDQINHYGYKRFPLMKAFRRLLEADVPAGSVGLDPVAVKRASRELYLLDGQISFDRALLYANIINSLDSTQLAYLNSMKGHGWNSWPDITPDQIRSKMQSLSPGTAVPVMTYAGDLFSWYAGSLEADVYFCPERHGTYYGGFYIKDAPAIGHEGYSIDEQLTATAGAALCDSSKGYVTLAQAAAICSLVDRQRTNLYAGVTNIVSVRTQIATLLRSLLPSTASSNSVQAQVLALSGTYGDLDGENNYDYATVFAEVYATLSEDQKTNLFALRHDILSGTYSNSSPFDFTVCTNYYLYSAVITDMNALAPYLTNTDYLFSYRDSVGDGIPDWWRAQYFGGSGATTNGSSCATCDFDGDSLTTFREYIADTDPTNSASRFQITHIRMTGNGVQLTWIGGSNVWQYLEWAPSLTTNQWNTIFTNSPPTAITNSATHTGATAAEQLFYRVRAQR